MSGIFAEYPNCALEINSEVHIKFLDIEKKLIGGIVNITPIGVEIAFRNLTRKDLDYIKTYMN